MLKNNKLPQHLTVVATSLTVRVFVFWLNKVENISHVEWLDVLSSTGADSTLPVVWWDTEFRTSGSIFHRYAGAAHPTLGISYSRVKGFHPLLRLQNSHVHNYGGINVQSRTVNVDSRVSNVQGFLPRWALKIFVTIKIVLYDACFSGRVWSQGGLGKMYYLLPNNAFKLPEQVYTLERDIHDKASMVRFKNK